MDRSSLENESSRAVVIGGCGYVGKRLVEMLCHRRTYDQIVVMDINVPSPPENLASVITASVYGSTKYNITRFFSKDVTQSCTSQCVPSTLPNLPCTLTDSNVDTKTASVLYVQGDVRCVADIINAITIDDDGTHHSNNPTTVFHLASPSPVSEAVETFDIINVQGSKNVIEACISSKVRNLIYCSSCSVIFDGTPLLNGTEDIPYPHSSLDPYSRSKALAEKYVLENNRAVHLRSGNVSLKTASIRPHMIFGPGDPCCIGGMLDTMKRGKSNFIIGDSTTLVTPTYIDNVCWGLLLAAEKLRVSEDIGGQAFNITNCEPVRFWSFFSNLCGELGYPRPMYRLPYYLVYVASYFLYSIKGSAAAFTPQKVRLVGNHHTYCGDKARKLLGYKPLVSLHDGLKATVEFTKLNDSDILHRMSQKAASCKAKGRNPQNLAVQSDLRVTVMSWLSFFILAWLCLSASARTACFAINFVLNLIGLMPHADSSIWGCHCAVLRTISPVIWSTSPNSLPGCVCAAAFFGVIALILRLYTTRSTVIGMSCGVPIAGDALSLRNGPTPVCSKLSREIRECYSLNVFGKPIVFFSGRDGYEFFFKASDEEVSLKEVYKISAYIFGKGVIYDVPTEQRQQQFYYLAQGLSEKKLQQYVGFILNECEAYFAKWSQTGSVPDLKSCLAELITLTACRCLLGKEVRETFYKECAKLLEDLDLGITPVSFIYPTFPLPAHRQRDRSRDKLISIFKQIMQRRRSAKVPSEGEEENDILSILMAAKPKSGASFTDEQIAGMLIALVFGGQHTSAITSTWTMINLLSRASRDDKVNVLEEQARIASNGITYDSVSKNTSFLAACLTESLRLSNPLAVVLRNCLKPREFKGHEFGKGTVIGVCVNEAGTNPDIFEDPLEFKPKRWIDCDWEEMRLQFQFVGFGAGRHTCMGRRFAHLQIKTILSYLMQTFVLTPGSSDLPLRDDKAMVIGPDRPYPVSYRCIQNNTTGLLTEWGLA